MFRRIFLFLLTNVMVIATISIVTHVLGLNYYLTANGLDLKTLAIFCAIWGTGGAFISLLMSKFIAKMGMGISMIDPARASGDERVLLDIVYELARKAKLPKMPEVGIYNSPELNAFATGPSKHNSLVAVSSGLLNSMSRQQIEGVLGHEITHVANGDMVTMTLVQGIVNAFAMFLSRIIAYAISIGMARSSDNDRGFAGSGLYFMLSFVFDILFTILGSLVVAAYSRWREYRADKGGAELAGRDNMIAALNRLRQTQEVEDDRAPALAALKISHKSGFLAWFASHPSLEKRIARLQEENSVIVSRK